MQLDFSPSDRPAAFGHHFIVGLSGTSLSDTDKRILATVRPAGLLLLKRNFDHTNPYPTWSTTLTRLLNDARAYAEREDLFVTLDHEGGRVHRVPPPLTLFPEPARYGHRAAEVATAMAIELRSIGVNVSWAPLADVHSNPANPVIGTRAFSGDPTDVAHKAVVFARALMDHGVLGCAKHFPGHGDTSTDSHHELPTVDVPFEVLRERELTPFQALIDIDIPFVMSAHILFPQIDPVRPATLSPKILGDILRGRMGFNNVVIGDDLDMRAVAHLFSSYDTVAHALNAGCDMFCVARFPDGTSERPIELAKNMAACLTRRLITEDRLFESFTRINRVATNRLKPSVVTPLEDEIFARHAALRDELR